MVSLQPAGSLCLGVDDFNEFGFERCSTHQETINVFLACQLFAGSTGYRAWTGKKTRPRPLWINNLNKTKTRKAFSFGWLTSIDDPHRVSHSLRDVILQPLPQFLMHLLSLRCQSKHIRDLNERIILTFSVPLLAVCSLYLLRGSRLASANGPNWLISQHNLAPVLYIVWEKTVDKTPTRVSQHNAHWLAQTVLE